MAADAVNGSHIVEADGGDAHENRLVRERERERERERVQWRQAGKEKQR